MAYVDDNDNDNIDKVSSMTTADDGYLFNNNVKYLKFRLFPTLVSINFKTVQHRYS